MQHNDEYQASQILCPFFGLIYINHNIIYNKMNYSCSNLNCRFRKSFICSVDISSMYSDMLDLIREAMQ